VYFTLFTVPKNTLMFLYNHESNHLKAFWKGLAWNWSN